MEDLKDFIEIKRENNIRLIKSTKKNEISNGSLACTSFSFTMFYGILDTGVGCSIKAYMIIQ